MEEGLPKGWESTNLENVVEILDRLRDPIKAGDRAKRIGDVPYYGATGRAGWIDDFIFDEELILLGEDGAPFFDHAKNVAYLIRGKSWVNNHAHVLRGETGILNSFLLHQLNVVNLHPFVSGTTRLKLPQGPMRQIPLLIPPTHEQQRILAKIEELFSELDAGIASLKTARAQLKIYRQALLKHAFEGKLTESWRKTHADQLESADQLLARISKEREAKYQPLTKEKIATKATLPHGWSYARFGAFVEAIGAGKSFSCDERRPTADEIGVAKVSAVTWGEYQESESKTCRDKAKVNPNYFIKEGDFLLSRANTIDLVGACVIAKNVTQRIMLSDKTLRLSLSGLPPEYFLYFLRSRTGRKEIMDRSTGNQESMRNIGQDRIRSIVVPICPAAEARVLIEILDRQFSEMDVLEVEIDTQLQKAEALRQSILKKAFSGQLVAQDPTDEPASVLLERIRAGREAGANSSKPQRTKK
jgi:type I restriction enzyme, S subunit